MVVEDRNAPPLLWGMWGAIQFETAESILTLFGFKRWLCWPSLSALWRKSGRPVLLFCAMCCVSIVPAVRRNDAKEQHSLLWDLLIFKTYFEAWKNRQSFLLKKTKFFILTMNIPRRRSISISRTRQYFSRFPFFLSFWQSRHTAAANHFLCQCICQLVRRKSPSTQRWAYDQAGNYRLLCNLILVCDWLHIKGPLNGSHWYLLR